MVKSKAIKVDDAGVKTQTIKNVAGSGASIVVGQKSQAGMAHNEQASSSQKKKGK